MRAFGKLAFVVAIAMAINHGQFQVLAQFGKKGGGLAGTGKATPAERIKVAKDFKVELLYTVPRDTQGSWVNMCVDPKGRLIVSDQGGAGSFASRRRRSAARPPTPRSRSIPAEISEAQGLLWAFDSLYVVVNGGGGKEGGGRPNGLYRVNASKPGGPLDKVELLRTHQRRRRARPARRRALARTASRSSACAATTRSSMSPLAGSHLPKLWGEDLLFPLIATFGGVVPPAAASTRSIPTARTGSCWSAGYRNQYDIAFNRDGELFTFDSDMEWDMNTPWYRPTRVCMATSGSEFGFRNGSGNLAAALSRQPARRSATSAPARRPASRSATAPSSPPSTRTRSIICDWSYGKLYAVHLTPDGSAYKAKSEEFATRHAAAADRHRRQPQGRRPVLHHRRPQHAVGAVPRHLHRQGIDRAVQGRRHRRRSAGHAAQAGSVPRQDRPEGRRDRLAVPGPRRSLHPLRRPRRHRASSRSRNGRTAP